MLGVLCSTVTLDKPMHTGPNNTKFEVDIALNLIMFDAAVMDTYDLLSG